MCVIPTREDVSVMRKGIGRGRVKSGVKGRGRASASRRRGG